MEHFLLNTLHVFISSVEQDKAYLAQLQTHLSPLERKGVITLWSYDTIGVGTDRATAIKQAISSAELVILLVSADFLASSNHYNDYLLLEARAAQGIKIIPVFVRPCYLGDTPLLRFQAMNRSETPVSSMSNAKQERIWQQLVDFVHTQARQKHSQGYPTLMNPPEAIDTNSRSTVMYKEDEDLSLSPDAREELIKALMSAFPRLADLDMLVSLKLDENLEAIAGQQNLEQAAFSLVNWARKTGNVRALVQGAHAQNSGNASLKAFARRYM